MPRNQQEKISGGVVMSVPAALIGFNSLSLSCLEARLKFQADGQLNLGVKSGMFWQCGFVTKSRPCHICRYTHESSHRHTIGGTYSSVSGQ